VQKLYKERTQLVLFTDGCPIFEVKGNVNKRPSCWG
jgi:hypothetical protein